jgi:hypothetical protein
MLWRSTIHRSNFSDRLHGRALCALTFSKGVKLKSNLLYYPDNLHSRKSSLQATFCRLVGIRILGVNIAWRYTGLPSSAKGGVSLVWVAIYIAATTSSPWWKLFCAQS